MTLKYSKKHTWAKLEGDVATVGITDFAQHTLKDIVFVELPKKGAKVASEKKACSIESIKAVSDVFSPVTGEVTEVNKAVSKSPGTVNKSPESKGWLFKVKIKDPKEFDKLLTKDKYQEVAK